MSKSSTCKVDASQIMVGTPMRLVGSRILVRGVIVSAIRTPLLLRNEIDQRSPIDAMNRFALKYVAPYIK